MCNDTEGRKMGYRYGPEVNNEREGRTVTLHDAQEFDDHFGGRADEDLTLASAFGIDYVVLMHRNTNRI